MVKAGDRYLARYAEAEMQIEWGAALAQHQLDLVETSRGQQVCVFYISHPEATITLVVSHGNALDAGFFVPFGRFLSRELKVNICVYDYTGYGCSSGAQPNIADTYSDIEAVVDHVVCSRGIDPRRVVLYGQSIGSGPSCRYAAESAAAAARGSSGRGGGRGAAKETGLAGVAGGEGTSTRHDIGGVVLVSPIMSGLRVISPPDGCCNPACVFSTCDIYPNYALVPKFTCPTLIMHGDQDVEVPFSHGTGLHERLRKEAKHDLDPYWVEGAGHDDVFEKNPEEFLRKMRKFLEMVESRAREGDDDRDGGGGGDTGSETAAAAAVVGGVDHLDHLAPSTGQHQRSSRGRGRDSGAPVRESFIRGGVGTNNPQSMAEDAAGGGGGGGGEEEGVEEEETVPRRR